VVSSQVDSSSTPARARVPGGKVARAQALIDEGTLLLNQGELGLAQRSLQQALEAIPEHPKAMALLARLHLARHDAAEALRLARRLIAKYPRNDAFQVLLGDAQALSGDLQAARTTWTEAARHGSSAAQRRLQ
jgi:Tfp pilus assembly protein PilF